MWSHLAFGLSSSQPKIPEERIPAHITLEVRREIERLYERKAAERGHGAYKPGTPGKEAIPAILFLISMLWNDNATVGLLIVSLEDPNSESRPMPCGIWQRERVRGQPLGGRGGRARDD